MGEVLQGGGDIARYAAIELGLTEVPGVAFNRHCASGMAPVQSGAAQHHGRHGRRRDRRRRRVDLDVAERDEAHAPRRRARAVDVAEPPRDARRARVRHVDHGRPEHRGQVRPHPRRHGRVGVPLAHARGAGDRRRPVAGGDLPDRGDPARRRPRRSSTSTSTRAARRSMEKLASLKPLHPEIEGFGVTAGNSSGLNDAGCGARARRPRVRRRARAEAAREDPLVGVDRLRAARHRLSARSSRSRRRSIGPA